VGESAKQTQARRRGIAGKMIAKAAIILCGFNHQRRNRPNYIPKNLYFKLVLSGQWKCIRLPGLNKMSQNAHQAQITTYPAAV
jgi:hypothetical protein